MTERPPTGGDGEKPPYDWLYGKQGRPTDGGADADPDATRRIPVQPRGTSGSPRQQPPPRQQPAPQPTPQPTPPLAPTPPSGPSGPSGRGPRRRPRFRFRYVFLLLVLWLIFLVYTPFHAWTKISESGFEPKGERPAEQPGTTYLMVGSDSRAGLSPEERKELGTGNASGQRTDTIMMLHTGSGPNLLMSIPRDSLVEVPGYGTSKINAAYAFGGPKLLTETIELNTGIRVDHYVEIGIGGFVDLVDAGDPVEAARAYDAAGADEICFLDIMATEENRGTMFDVVTRTAEQCFIPLTVGGGVRTVADVRSLLLAGADKVSFNSAAVADPDVVTAAADQFGSQCIVVAIDAKTVSPGRWEIFTHGGRTATGIDAVAFALDMERRGAGEILLTSVDREGTGKGFDLELLKAVTDRVDIPVIASLNGITEGGWLEHAACLEQAGCDAIELNIYYIAASVKESSDQIERRYIDLVYKLRAQIGVPISVKLTHQFSSVAHLVKRLEDTGFYLTGKVVSRGHHHVIARLA